MTTVRDPRPLLPRLWDYQAERFPLVNHGVLIAAFASSGVCVSAQLAGRTAFPGALSLVTAFIVLLGLLLLLRIADEFKDAEVDAVARPERPVPRGLVSLRELGGLGVLVAGVQGALCLWVSPTLAVLLFVTWAYMLLMTREFFVADWLRARLLPYMLSHMLVMPLIDLFATACDWALAEGRPPPGLAAFIALSFFNGIVVEIGRKTWAPEQEKPGADSYSSAWGLRRALVAWLAAAGAALLLALVVAWQIGFVAVLAPVLVGLFALLVVLARQMRRAPTPAAAKRLEKLSGLWLVASYLGLGLIPLGLTALGWR